MVETFRSRRYLHLESVGLPGDAAAASARYYLEIILRYDGGLKRLVRAVPVWCSCVRPSLQKREVFHVVVWDRVDSKKFFHYLILWFADRNSFYLF